MQHNAQWLKCKYYSIQCSKLFYQESTSRTLYFIRTACLHFSSCNYLIIFNIYFILTSDLVVAICSTDLSRGGDTSLWYVDCVVVNTGSGITSLMRLYHYHYRDTDNVPEYCPQCTLSPSLSILRSL